MPKEIQSIIHKGVSGSGGAKKSSGSSRTPVESPNSLRSNAIARILDLIGEGPIGGLVNGAQSIYLDDTPLENADGSLNFSGVNWEFRTGEPDQDPIAGFDEVETEQIVEAELTRQNGAIVRQITDLNVDAARVRLRLPNMSYSNPSNGDLLPTSVEVRIEVKPSDGEYRPINFLYNEVSREGQTTTGANAVGFKFFVKKRVLVKLNSTAEVELEARYRKTSAAAWTTLGRRVISQRITTVANPHLPDGYIDGQPAYYHTFTASYSLMDLGANEYQIDLVDGDAISGFTAYKKANTLIEGKNTAPTEKSYRFSLPGKGPWLLRLTRITEDSQSAGLQNSTIFSGFTEIVEQKFIYPDSAYIGLSVNSELFGNQIPSRAYDVYGREVMVPTTYDPIARTYGQFWDGTFKQAWTDNPAWCFLDMLISERFGLGHRITIDQIDTAKLYEIAQYCDELVPDGFGGFEPRFTLNCVINTRQEAFQILNTMASVFRGMVYWHSGSVAFGYDAPRDVDVIVGRANVIDGKFVYSTAADRAQHNSILVTWNDPSDNDRPNIEVVEDNDDIAKRGLNQSDVYAFGCKSRGQASRVGKWILYTEKYEQETVTYRASLDHLNVVPGMIIGVVDPKVSGAEFAGRTMQINGTQILLDRKANLVINGSYELNAMDATGKIQTRTIISNTTVEGRTQLQLNAPFNPEPQKGRMWSISGTDIKPRQFRVVTIVETEKNIFEISAIEYNPSKHDYIDRDFVLEPVNYSLYSSGKVQPPTGLDIVETLFKTNNQLRTRATVSWIASTDSRAFMYRVVWRQSNGGAYQERVTSDNGIDITDLEPGTYDFYVYAIAAAGISEALKIEGYSILGKTAPPGDVQNLRAVRQVNGVVLQWDAVQDLDLVGYEVRKGEAWDSAELVAEIVGTSLFVSLDDAEPTTLLVRAKDQLGILSQNVTPIVSSVIAPDVPPMFTAVAQADHVLFRWTRVAGVDNKYEVRRGVSWAAAEVIAEGTGDEILVLDPQRDTAIYWIRSKSSAGLYSEKARAASAQRALIPDRNIVLEYDNANDGGAGTYPGYTFDMEGGPDNSLILASNINRVLLADNTGDLLLENNDPFYLEGVIRATYGEHYFTVDLGQEIRARFWLETNLVNILEGGPTWESFNYSWDAAEANVTWLPLGDLGSAQLTKVIAWERDPLDEELYAFGFDDTTTDFRGIVVPAEEIGISYLPAKFGNGVFLNDLAKLSYDVSLQSTFTFTFKIHSQQTLLDKRVFARFTNDDGEFLEIGFDKAFDAFYAEDHIGNRFGVDAVLNPDEDYIFIGFVQDNTKRILYYRSDRSYYTGNSEADFPISENPYNKMFLYRATT